MLRTKLILLGSIVATALAGWYDGSTPYYPIEISRTATGPISYYVFCLGTFLTLVSAYDQVKTKYHLMPLVGLVLLTIFDDSRFWFLHNLAVAIMVCGVCCLVVELIQPPKKDKVVHRILSIAFSALGVFILRMIFKNIAVIVYELDCHELFESTFGEYRKFLDSNTTATFLDEAPPTFQLLVFIMGLGSWCIDMTVSIIAKAISTYIDIMYTGVTRSVTTLYVFKFCGVLQWIVFYLFTMLYDEEEGDEKED
jgi:hypothetical protein